MSPSRNEWSYRPGRGVIENHLGRRLRALYDALPTQVPSRDICAQLRRLDEAGARSPDRTPGS